MLKLITSDSFYNEEESSISIIDLKTLSSGLEKKAAHEDIQTYINTLQPKPNHTYLHINAMTAGEWYSSNRNGDFFPEENLRKYYKTFETTPAYVYRSHINKDPKRSYGKVIYSVYNERMHRVELICECPDSLVEDINDRIQMGDYPTTSMATRTPYDTCSICGNKAHSRQEYCTHLSSQLNKLYPDGKKVFAINNGALTFFDISIVVRPADVNSSILQKVADDHIIGSAEMAEIEGLTEEGFLSKKAEFKKFSELIKEITDGCYVVGAHKGLGVGAASDLPLSAIQNLHSFDLSQVFCSMAALGISPSVQFLAELIARKHLGEGYEGIGDVVKNFLDTVPESTMTPVIRFEEPTETNPIISSILEPYIGSASLFSDAIEKRAYYSSGIGYAGNGPHIEPTYEEVVRSQHPATAPAANEISTGKLLLGLGAAALLAKYFITTQIEKKLREAQTMPQNNVKIVIVKKASDCLVTSQLAKLAMITSLPEKQKENGHSGIDPSRVGIKLTKRLLVNPDSRIGGKLANLLRIFSLGSKLTSDY